ncbi:MAG: hypothetical protein AAB416_05000 [Patescibacteria group bacterium]
MSPLLNLLLATGATFGGEAAIFWLCGFRSRNAQYVLLFANGITFPLFRFALLMGASMGHQFGPLEILAAELAIVLVEFALLMYGMRRAPWLRLGVAVLCVNIFSFFVGELLLWG